MAVTIRDVANHAGVSPATVSRVINHKGVISDDTTQRILRAMKELNYVPNEYARGLATGNSYVIALVIDVTNQTAYFNSFFSNTVAGIETAAHKNNYDLLITNGSMAYGGLSSAERLVHSKKIDGIILPESSLDMKFLRELGKNNFPCVILGCMEFAEIESNRVDVNNVQAAAKAVQYLLGKGYGKIAFLMGKEEENFNRNRMRGYREELEKNGIPYVEDYLIHCPLTVESGWECAEGLFALPDPPDAVICGSDRLALGVQRYAMEKGYRVPADVGILSFDNTNITETALPSITSIDIDTFELGMQAAGMLIGKIENASQNTQQLFLSAKIVERSSTKK